MFTALLWTILFISCAGNGCARSMLEPLQQKPSKHEDSVDPEENAVQVYPDAFQHFLEILKRYNQDRSSLLGNLFGNNAVAIQKSSNDHSGPFQKSNGQSGPFQKSSNGHSGPFQKSSNDHSGPFQKSSNGHSGPFHRSDEPISFWNIFTKSTARNNATDENILHGDQTTYRPQTETSVQPANMRKSPRKREIFYKKRTNLPCDNEKRCNLFCHEYYNFNYNLGQCESSQCFCIIVPTNVPPYATWSPKWLPFGGF